MQGFLAHCLFPQQRERILAFYGGSFTGIREDLLARYLEVAAALVQTGVVHGVKASTRPDLVDAAMAARLRAAGFVEIELGAQSFDDEVLARSRRGHTAADTQRAAHVIRRAGLRLGLQLMPGLPGEDRASFRGTVQAVLALKPDTARVYPTVVLAGTELEESYRCGAYAPLLLEEAVERALLVSVQLQALGCSVLRLGLPPADGLRVVAGPMHPCFGLLVQARGFFHLAAHLMACHGTEEVLQVHPQDVAALLGYRRANQRALGFHYAVDHGVPRGSLSVTGQTEYACLSVMDIINHLL